MTDAFKTTVDKRSWKYRYGQYRKRLWTAFLKGWDAAIILPHRASNPYHRQDFADYWSNGYKHCLRGDALPDFLRYPWRDE